MKIYAQLLGGDEAQSTLWKDRTKTKTHLTMKHLPEWPSHRVDAGSWHQYRWTHQADILWKSYRSLAPGLWRSYLSLSPVSSQSHRLPLDSSKDMNPLQTYSDLGTEFVRQFVKRQTKVKWGRWGREPEEAEAETKRQLIKWATRWDGRPQQRDDAPMLSANCLPLPLALLCTRSLLHACAEWCKIVLLSPWQPSLPSIGLNCMSSTAT